MNKHTVVNPSRNMCVCGGCRLTHHHRLPKSLGGIKTIANLSVLPQCIHVSWHGLFENWRAWLIARQITHKSSLGTIVAVPRWWGIKDISHIDAESIGLIPYYPNRGFYDRVFQNHWETFTTGLHTRKSILQRINSHCIEPYFVLVRVRK